MEGSEPNQRRLVGGVLSIATALTLVGALLAAFVVDRSAVLPLHLPWWSAFVGLFLAGMAPLMLEVQSNTFSLSLTEVPIVVALLGMQRVPMVLAGTAGWFLALVLSRRRAPLKLALNIPLMFFEMCVTAAFFDVTVDRPSLTAWTTWLALVGGLTCAIVLSTTAVNVVISLAGDRISLRQAVRHSLLGVANAAMATSLTVLAAVALRETVAAFVPIVLLAAVSILPLRRQAKLQRRYDGLLLLHEFTAGLTSSTDLSTTLGSVLVETSKVLRSADASILLPREGDAFHLGLKSDSPVIPGVDDAVWRAVVGHGESVRLERGSHAFDGYLADHGLKDLMAVPLVHGDQVIGALVVRDRLGEVSTFDADDLSIFSTMANQTTVTLENLRLIDRLRDESAEREHQALHDELTGLPNRAHLYATLDQRLREGNVAVAVLDLNRFKEVNDTLGHHVGDEVLVQTGQRLRKALPSSALVARLGGDEFAIVLFGVTRAADATAKLVALERVFTEPIVLDAMSLRVDASIGVAVSPEHGTDRGMLLRRADVAMYAAKQIRGTTVRAYDRSQERSSKRSLEIVGELRRAIETGGLDVAFQPKGRLLDGAIVGAEALVRWEHASLGPIAPDEFVPLAEQAGLIDALTDVVLRRSLDACAEWRTNGHQMSVAVNVDALTLLTPGFVDGVIEALRARSLPPSALTIEITERELVRELETSASAIGRLRSVGVAFSIDDFGTGYSSLSYLTRLPVDEVKIDKSFVEEAVRSPQHEAIIRAVADIARSLHLTTVVEGIEDERTWALVASLGCTLGQGYHLARPMLAGPMLAWLNDRASVGPDVHDRGRPALSA
jgi:diguanylate cyclase (GGDEF)-like protein